MRARQGATKNVLPGRRLERHAFEIAGQRKIGRRRRAGVPRELRIRKGIGFTLRRFRLYILLYRGSAYYIARQGKNNNNIINDRRRYTNGSRYGYLASTYSRNSRKPYLVYLLKDLANEYS